MIAVVAASVVGLARTVLIGVQCRTAEPGSIEWTPPARPCFQPAVPLVRPRTDSNHHQQRSVLDWYLEVG